MWIAAPHLMGSVFKLFVKIVEAPVIGSLIVSHLKKQNKMVEVCYCHLFTQLVYFPFLLLFFTSSIELCI